jgi:16S rRNA C967 or C1407 C5-methylase (RsmB/RsmF family)
VRKPSPRKIKKEAAKNAVPRFMQKQAEELFEDVAERAEFTSTVLAGESRDQAILVMADRVEIRAFPREQKLSWQPNFVERIQPQFRVAKHPLHAKGAFYSLDFSSVFSACSLQAIQQPPRRVLDLCASPGGKAIFAWRMFKPELLYCCESVRKRTGTLIGNLDRCGATGSMVWSADSSVCAKKFVECFDLILCDAPCSGQSLIAKGDTALGCWDPRMIDMNVGRQRRIVGNAYHCLAPGGYLMYATCTYTKKENEKVVEWLLKEYEDLETVELPFLNEFRSKYSEANCYRLFPQHGLGAGAFVCLFRKKGQRPDVLPEFESLPKLWAFGDPVHRAPQVTAPEELAPPEEVDISAHRKSEREVSARQVVRDALGIKKVKYKKPPKEPPKPRKVPKSTRRGNRPK